MTGNVVVPQPVADDNPALVRLRDDVRLDAEFGPSAALEVLDDNKRQRVPDTDAEILDRAAFLRQITRSPVTMTTGDPSMGRGCCCVACRRTTARHVPAPVFGRRNVGSVAPQRARPSLLR